MTSSCAKGPPALHEATRGPLCEDAEGWVVIKTMRYTNVECHGRRPPSWTWGSQPRPGLRAGQHLALPLLHLLQLRAHRSGTANSRNRS